jgi:hypothetical protein
MLKLLVATAVCAAALMSSAPLSSADAAEPFVGRWGVSAAACAGTGDSGGRAVLVASATTLSWVGNSCRIGKMYKAGEAVYLQVHCGGEGDVPVTLAAHGDRMQVTWNRAKLSQMQRCR